MTRQMTRTVSALLWGIAFTATGVDAVEPRTAVPVYVEPTKDDGGKFSDLLKVELSKRRGLIKAKVDIVRTPETAVYILESSINYRRKQWHEGWLTNDKATATAAIFAYDRCGKMVWSKTKGDRDIFSDARGVQETASKVAASFKEALAKKNSRLNRAEPCLRPGDEVTLAP